MRVDGKSNMMEYLKLVTSEQVFVLNDHFQHIKVERFSYQTIQDICKNETTNNYYATTYENLKYYRCIIATS